MFFYRKDIKRAHSLERWYKAQVGKRRTAVSFFFHWRQYEGILDFNKLDVILVRMSSILKLPNHFIYPLDRSSLFFFDPHREMREVEMIMLFEEFGVRDLSLETLSGKYKYFIDILIHSDVKK